ncbi:MAG: nuclear transport factor 2 family protein [Streptosporangiales bacterium]|nr:nuclear transport factor 2 family protein [Streptosporangiales bacterium]
MQLTAEDRVLIAETISLHGHVFDDGELDRLDELFTPDVVYDVSDFGQQPIRGIGAIRDAALAMGDANPVGHHVTNIVITGADGDEATARSKGIGVMADGSCGSVVYVDTLRRHAGGWRICHRKVIARRMPLGG